MNWTDPYTEDLRALERLRYDILPIDFSRPESVQKDFDSLAPVLDELTALLKDRANNSTALEKATELWWNRWGLGEMANSRKEAEIEIKLQPLYQRLKEASDEEVREYARFRIRLRLGSPVFNYLAQRG